MQQLTFQERKQERKDNYEKYVKGWKEIPCIACNGTGYYDDFNSPKCESCNGTGKTKVNPEEYKEYMKLRNL